GVGQLAQAVVDADGGAPAVDDAVAAAPEKEGAAAAGVGAEHLDADVAREDLDFAPGAAAGVEVPQAELPTDLGEVAHEDVVETDEQGLPHRVQGQDAQRHQHRVGVGGLNRDRGGRAGPGGEAHVAPDQVELVIDALEEEDPLLIEVEGPAAQA